MTDQNGWIAWAGGECPVLGNKAIEVLTQSACVLFDYAKKFRWSHENMHGTHEPKASNVIAYRYRYRIIGNQQGD